MAVIEMVMAMEMEMEQQVLVAECQDLVCKYLSEIDIIK
jgi:hypothetical protein